MTNTIPNVPRELLNIAALHLEYSGYTETGKKLRTLLDAAPSPAGVDGLEVVAWQHWGDRTKLLCALGKERGTPGGYTDEFTRPLCRLSDVTAIIDGMRGEAESRVEAALSADRTASHQQAQRISELEGLLQHASKYIAPGAVLTLIKSTLSAGKEGE